MNRNEENSGYSKVPEIRMPDGITPERLGSGTVRAILGEGELSIIYEIWVEKLGNRRAIKLLRPNVCKEVVKRLASEMKTIAQLKHSNIVSIYKAGEWNGTPFVEMEYVDGISLEVLIRSRGALPLEVCTSIGIMICRALVFTHEYNYEIDGKTFKGTIHGDLKPTNVLVSTDGIVKITDFGMSIPLKISLHIPLGNVVGSIQYLSPEQLDGATPDRQSDIFSFGCILYEMVTGGKAFPEESMDQLIADRYKNRYIPLSQYQTSNPPGIRKLINKCICLDVSKRGDDVYDILVKLEKIHNRITRYPPEEVVEFFINTTEGYNEVPFRKSRVLVVSIISICVIAVILVTAKLLFFQKPEIDYLAYISEINNQNSFQTNRSGEPFDTLISNLDMDTNAYSKFDSSRSLVISDSFIPKKDLFRRSKRVQSSNQKLSAMSNHIDTIKTDRITKVIDSSILINVEKKDTIPINPIGALKKQYGTDDLLFILNSEVRKGHFEIGLDIYDRLPDDLKSSTKALLLKLKLLKGVHDQVALSRFLQQNTIADKEFLLAKGQYKFTQRLFSDAIDQFQKVIATNNVLFGNGVEIDNAAMYYIALGYTRLYDTKKASDMKQKAMESWFSVKYRFRENQSHSYFRQAEHEIRRLASLGG